MTPRHLPFRITLLMALTIALFLLAVGGTTLWLTWQLNERAQRDAETMVQGAIGDVRQSLRNIAIDYSIWTRAYEIMMAQDQDAIYAEYASGATNGDIFQLLALTDGPFEGTRSWIADGAEEPAPGLVPEPVIDEMRERVAAVEVGSSEVPQFFAEADGVLYLFGGTRVEHEDPEAIGSPEPSSYPLAVFGSRIGEELLEEIAFHYLLRGLRVTDAEPRTGSRLPLAGAAGTPVAWLSWEAPTPGTELLGRLIWPLLGVLGLFVLITTAVTRMARRYAEALVREEKRSSVAARTDTLTRLPNRMALGEALQRAERKGEAAILFFDVNGFKRVNDTIGHLDGDILVKKLADRLRRIQPAPDFLGRVGGDEFVMMLTGPGASARVGDLGGKVREEMIPPFEVRGKSFHVTAALGYACRDKGEVSLEELLRRADLAMYHGKKQGTTAPVRYDPAIDHGSQETLRIQEALHDALDAPEEFSMLYQPVMDAATGRMVKAEALARWDSARLGPVGPDKFIMVAEESGLILDVGGILFRKVCEDMQRWPELEVSINVSPLQLNDGEFVRKIIGILGEMEIEPGRIEIELTERLMVASPEMAAFKLDQLREAGFRTALDDFGTGFSSIGYLKRLPFNTVKIDRSFMADVPDDERAVQMVSSIIMLGHSLELAVVGEGVETAEQAEALRGHGCDLLQGYLFARPMTLDQLREVPQADAAASPPRRRARSRR